MDFAYEFWNPIANLMHSAIFELGNTLSFKADCSEFTVVDGEEGDHGKITYRTNEGVIVAVRTILGGDDEETEFTPEGREIMLKLIMPKLFDALAVNPSSVGMTRAVSILEAAGWKSDVAGPNPARIIKERINTTYD